ncbi:MAG: FecR domain-containing protein [Opitutaceae bacterium]|nr:FecR domain-containing protein [Opitutaceae bacterium]
MNLRKLILSLTVALGLAAPALAQTTQTQATVARVTGAATVTLPDGSTTPLTAGMKVAQGSTITTGADGDVYLESHAGYVTSIKHDSIVAVDEISVTTEGGQVKEERTMLDLKSGNLVAKLDPKKKSVNNYQVRTPKGVAAARGTVFTVMFRGEKYSVAVVNGSVSIVPVNNYLGREDTRVLGGGTDSASTLNAGQVLTEGGSGVLQRGDFSVENSAANTESDTRELLAAAVATVTLAAQNGIGGTTAAEAAAVAKAVFDVAPGVAAQAGALIKQSNDRSPPADAARASEVLNAVTSATPAASAGFTSGNTTGTFTTTTTTTRIFGPTTTTTTVTTPQPIDPSTISRSNE